MAVKYESFCVGCTSMGLPCYAPHCKNYNVPIWYCDECKEEQVDLYEYEGQELCGECVLKMLPKVHEE